MECPPLHSRSTSTAMLVILASLPSTTALRVPGVHFASRGGRVNVRAAVSETTTTGAADLQQATTDRLVDPAGRVVPTSLRNRELSWLTEAAEQRAVAPPNPSRLHLLPANLPGPLEMLKEFGGAYLLVSITMSLLSYTLFYALVSNGLDVRGLLLRCGLRLGDRAGAVSTIGLAYVAHKAASPLRFLPTVALTPVVARALQRLFGKGPTTSRV